MAATPGTPKGGNPPTDPFIAFNFMLELGSILTAGFHDCSGVDSTIEVIEYREGGQNTTVKKVPGQTKYSNIVLKRGMYADSTLYNWHKASIEGPPQRMDGSVVQYDRQGNEVARYNFYRAWPTKYTAPTYNAQGNDIAIETLELAHEGVERVK